MKVKLLFLLVIVGFTSCEDDLYMPKPKSYFRIDLPDKKYVNAVLDAPLEFEKPLFSVIENLSPSGDKFNLVYPLNKAKIHFSYFGIEKQEFQSYVEDAYNYAYQHNIKASAIQTKSYAIDSTSVYGLLYDLKGNVASPIQFIVTDSTTHFLRGALYFEHRPNADSIAPVLEYITKDIDHLYNTIHWK